MKYLNKILILCHQCTDQEGLIPQQNGAMRIQKRLIQIIVLI
jgi:hypothetical protein